MSISRIESLRMLAITVVSVAGALRAMSVVPVAGALRAYVQGKEVDEA